VIHPARLEDTHGDFTHTRSFDRKLRHGATRCDTALVALDLRRGLPVSQVFLGREGHQMPFGVFLPKTLDLPGMRTWEDQ